MFLKKRITEDEMWLGFRDGNRVSTSFERRATDTREFLCASCQRPFFLGKKGVIFYDLCDPCFEAWNVTNLVSRFSGGTHDVPIQLEMYKELP